MQTNLKLMPNSSIDCTLQNLYICGTFPDQFSRLVTKWSEQKTRHRSLDQKNKRIWNNKLQIAALNFHWPFRLASSESLSWCIGYDYRCKGRLWKLAFQILLHWNFSDPSHLDVRIADGCEANKASPFNSNVRLCCKKLTLSLNKTVKTLLVHPTYIYICQQTQNLGLSTCQIWAYQPSCDSLSFLYLRPLVKLRWQFFYYCHIKNINCT